MCSSDLFKNGMLPIRVEEDTLAKLMDDAERGQNARLTIDLENQTISGPRSEERRVGKEGRSGRWRDHQQQTKTQLQRRDEHESD